MKTKTNRKQEAAESLPKEVREAERARRKFKAAFEKFSKLSDKPIVKEYLEAQQPKLSEAEQREKEVQRLYDDFFRCWDYNVKFLHVLGDLAAHSIEISLEDIEPMLIEIDRRMWPMRSRAARAFQLLGYVTDEFDAEQIAEALKDDEHSN